jgi:hypothetical protein
VIDPDLAGVCELSAEIGGNPKNQWLVLPPPLRVCQEARATKRGPRPRIQTLLRSALDHRPPACAAVGGRDAGEPRGIPARQTTMTRNRLHNARAAFLAFDERLDAWAERHRPVLSAVGYALSFVMLFGAVALHAYESGLAHVAQVRRVAGISRPSALAVLRLMTRSNLVGWSTGRSAGLSPLRMRCRHVALPPPATLMCGVWD